MPMSKSSLQGLVLEYGGRLVAAQAAEAQAMVQVPEGVSEGEAWRAIPEPDSPVMAVAMDGGMVHVRGEGWKETKVVAISAVEAGAEAGGSEGSVVELRRTSYRAGLWDAASFGPQQWAEACRRGLEKAEQVVCVNDGAPWIWLIVAMCYVPCIEILDWWHAVQKLWELAFLLLGAENEASPGWAGQQKALLWAGQLRQVFRQLRLLCPRGQALPDKVPQAIGYLFRHRHRMRYPEFRRAGYPIGSGSVESACKVVMQERMKQAGMSWSRPGAQAMLALRSVLLSERWTEVWPSLAPPKLA